MDIYLQTSNFHIFCSTVPLSQPPKAWVFECYYTWKGHELNYDVWDNFGFLINALFFFLDRPVLGAMGVVICNVESVGGEAG